MEKQIKERFEKVENRVDSLEKFVDEGLSKNGRLIKCPKCKNSWITRSNKLTVSCSSCGYKVKIEQKPKKKEILYVKGKSWEEVAKKGRMF